MVVPPVEKYHSYLNFDEPEKSQLPRIDITMDDDYMLSRKDYTGCSVQISNASEYDLDKTEAKIRIRGNSTAHADKKNYKIKFPEKISLFGGGEEKSWVLLANVDDITGIHNLFIKQFIVIKLLKKHCLERLKDFKTKGIPFI